jgi:tellurite resistance protein TerC
MIAMQAHAHPRLYPFDRFWWLYGLFVLAIVASLLLDMRRRNGKEHAIGHGEALRNALLWIGLALLFAAGLYFYGIHEFPLDPRLAGLDHAALARQSTFEFLSGWLMEKSLSVDNLFVFLVVFDFFAIPPPFRHRILFYGILGALVFRALFIAMGALLMQISWVPVVLGIFLCATGLKVAFGPESHPDPEKNPVVGILRRFLPITHTLRDGKFLVREAGRVSGTPLLLALAVIEFTDIVFAVDSVPAVFAITSEPFLVFTSNVFAILGLRALYFILEGMASKFHFLKYGLGFILAFVGMKMAWLDHHIRGGVPTGISLLVIAVSLSIAVLVSYLFPSRPSGAK